MTSKSPDTDTTIWLYLKNKKGESPCKTYKIPMPVIPLYLTTLLPGAKKTLSLPSQGVPRLVLLAKAPVRASPIAFKRKPGQARVEASPQELQQPH